MSRRPEISHLPGPAVTTWAAEYRMAVGDEWTGPDEYEDREHAQAWFDAWGAAGTTHSRRIVEVTRRVVVERVRG